MIPPRIDHVRDDDMNDRSNSRDHRYLAGTFTGLGSQVLTIGNSSCGIRLTYSFTATRQ